MKRLYLNSFKTSVGTVRTAATAGQLVLITLPSESRKYYEDRIATLFGDHTLAQGGKINRKAEKQITAYLDGKLAEFDLPLEIIGTSFQKKALKQVSRIPYGKTCTYGEIAHAIGSPGAARAVGSANAKNNLPLVIPCHRVVASNGLGGYGGGLPLKKKLLKLEGSM
ncbi:MAG: methylated-DNA--[protein]-cysteine S-methyltransferase [candidate division Zixibacteria bacterium]|nr:methylated-DNA--[protein]-cysteine S-methyltransferase [candidate division Zixibacteria bacterium]MDH3937084.1 methylated-DNA--[protein]-cysteine S-methyltransferase [candidate division Zixibacteria bacterium]MDH4035199.1 methylated-DNA--[protein]-cysteine S-methyltransferase [candidate division Zixibacteria bacterium]